MDPASEDDRVDPGEIVAQARAWIGTPYRHQASCKGAGADCLGLLRGLWREIYGVEPQTVPAYSPDWSEADRGERLVEAAAQHLLPVPVEAAEPGDVVILRMASGGAAKHVAIRAAEAAGYPTLIHAYSGQGVVESPLSPAWQRRIAAAFRFPPRRR